MANRDRDRLFDVRTVRRNVRSGLVTDQDHKAFLAELPDRTDNSELVRERLGPSFAFDDEDDLDDDEDDLDDDEDETAEDEELEGADDDDDEDDLDDDGSESDDDPVLSAVPDEPSDPDGAA